MTERILVWNQLDSERLAMSIEPDDFFRRQRPPAAPDGFIVAVGKGVLGVKLKLVDLEIRETVRQCEQGAEVGDPAARDVEHDAAFGEVGIIPNHQARNPAAILAK